MNLTRELAEYVSALEYDALSAGEVDRLKLGLCDWLAVALAGCQEEATRTVQRYVLDAQAPGRASVLGSGMRTSPHLAAFANAVAGHVLDYDDITTLGSGHPSAPVVPAVLAMAEQHGSNGRALLTAMAVGISVELALGLAIMPGHYERGYHNTATLGRIGAAAGASSVVGLPPEECSSALAIAATSASGLRSSFGSPLKSIQVGMAAQGGVMSAELAMSGVTTSSDLLGGRHGLFEVMAPSAQPDHLLAVVSERNRNVPCRASCKYGTAPPASSPAESLATESSVAACSPSGSSAAPRAQALIETIRPKRYPSCLSTHGAIHAALRIRPRIPDMTQVATVDCTVHPLCLDVSAIPRPRNGLEAKFSVQYCIAVALTDGQVELASFTDHAVQRPAVTQLASKVNVKADAAYTEERECRLVITLRDRTRLETHARLFEGHSLEEDWQLARGKLTEALNRAGSPTSLADEIVERILSIEGVDSVAELTCLLRHLGDPRQP